MTILGLITVTGGVAVLLASNGLLDLLAAELVSGSILTATGAGLVFGVYRLCRHRHDLTDS